MAVVNSRREGNGKLVIDIDGLLLVDGATGSPATWRYNDADFQQALWAMRCPERLKVVNP